MGAESASEQLSFHLQGNFAPVQEEKTAVDLEVQGAIPPELRGLYLRNGPNPQSGGSPTGSSAMAWCMALRSQMGRRSGIATAGCGPVPTWKATRRRS